MATKGPDDFTESTTEDLDEQQLTQLNKVWPAGFRAASTLLLMIDEGEIDKDSPLMSMNLFDLVCSSFEEDKETED